MAYASTKYPSIFCHITATGYAHTTLVPIAGSGAIIADIIAAVKLTASTGGGTVCIANRYQSLHLEVLCQKHQYNNH